MWQNKRVVRVLCGLFLFATFGKVQKQLLDVRVSLMMLLQSWGA